MKSRKDNISFVLVEPCEAQNIGASAKTSCSRPMICGICTQVEKKSEKNRNLT
jgi:hypothetical protein